MKKIITLLFVISLIGCSVHKQWVPTGGSKADGTVKMSYEIGSFQRPILDAQQGIESAKSRCQAWGYRNAEPFGGQVNTCLGNGYGCNRKLVTAEYQCLD